jgi:outer membrane murein-binding lipoprotein Lpp
MISGKGILYTILGAAGAAVVAGTMLTGGKRTEKFRKLGSGLQNFIGSMKRKALNPDQPSGSDQPDRIGHA